MADFMAQYLGGDEEDYDIMKGRGGIINMEGDQVAWDYLVANTNNYAIVQENMDIDNYIDYMLLNFYGGNDHDWYPSHNWVAGRKREAGSKFMFFMWDNDFLFRRYNGNTIDNGGPANMFPALKQHEEFRIRLADRAQKHFFNDGMLTPDRVQADFTELTNRIERVIIPECARWLEEGSLESGITYTPDTLQQSVDWIKFTHGNDRTDIVVQQMRDVGIFPSIDAPTFSRHGGEIAPTEPISMTAPTGTIWYTIDGADPRAGSGGGSTTSFTLVDEEEAKTVLIPTETDPGDDTWRSDYGFDDGTWISGFGGVGYHTRPGYESYIDINVETTMRGVNTSCYIRIPFTFSGNPNDFNYMTLKMRYDDGFIAYLNGRKVEEINFSGGEPVWNSEADTYLDAGPEFTSFDISDHLDRLQTGNNLLAIHGLNDALTSSDFLMCIELEAGNSTPDGVSPSAVQYTDPIYLTESANVKARAFSGGEWSALNEAIFAVGPLVENLRITEMMYHPQDTNNPDDPNAEFIELKNIGLETTINLSLVQFTKGIGFTFPSLELEPNEYVLVVKDQTVFASRYKDVPPDVDILGPYEGWLANGGERIRLEDAIGRKILDFEYRDGWRPITDGDGFSLIIIDPTNSDPNSWGQKDSWRASVYRNGSPGWDDSGILPNPGAIVINEVMAHSYAGPDWIELYNTTDESVNIGGWFLSDNDRDEPNLTKYRIADGTTIASNKYIVFYQDANFSSPNDPGCIVPFALSENGEEVCLSSHLDPNGFLTGYRQVEDFGASQTNVSLGRYFKASTGNFNFVAMDYNTPDSNNAYPKVGPVVINEIMYNPPSGNQNEEYIELHNITGVTVTLYRYDKSTSWKFTDGIDYTFNPSPVVTIPAYGYLILARDLTAFTIRYGSVSSDVRVLDGYSGRLSNAGERLQIAMPGDVDEFDIRQYIRVDRVTYSDGLHPEDCPGGVDYWPREADGLGKSLSRKVPKDYGNDVANWQAATPSPGVANP